MHLPLHCWPVGSGFGLELSLALDVGWCSLQVDRGDPNGTLPKASRWMFGTWWEGWRSEVKGGVRFSVRVLLYLIARDR